ncbi:MAG: hypothetical protein COB66_02235 [Coxiella sp. (in: Bacteria)]|nr:MAG: hypothetical protein COB66_02235 [Coxiella sp. (in: g-proteobacteria)]
MQVGMNRILKALDLVQRAGANEQLSKDQLAELKHLDSMTAGYQPKVHMNPIALSQFPELSNPHAVNAQLKQGAPYIFYANINASGSLFTNAGQSVSFYRMVHAIKFLDNSYAQVWYVHSKEPLRAYLFDTYVVDDKADARQRQSRVIHITEVDAHLKETHPPAALRHFFPELISYEQDRDDGHCPRMGH